MSETVSAAEANRRFSRLLAAVREGGSFVITSHGRPVAQLSAPGGEREDCGGARRALIGRLRGQPAMEAGRWTREELYERGR